MRAVILILIAAGLVVAGCFILRGIIWVAETPEPAAVRTATVPAGSPAPAAEPAADPVPGQAAPSVTPQPPPAAKNEPAAQEPEVSVKIREAPTGDGTGKRLLDEAVDAFNASDFQASLKLFNEALTYNRGARTGLGLSYYKLGDYPKAVSELTRSLSENGPEFNAFKFLSLAHYKLDDLEQSENYASRALGMVNDREFRKFYEKVHRERAALTNRVDESNLHFKVVFDGYEHGSISRLILDTLDSAYRDIGREFGHFPDQTITVVLYTEQDFFDVTRAPSWTGGLFDGKIRVPVKGAESVDRELLRTVLYHEYVHAMVHDIAQDVPRWVHEGLAEYLVPRGLEHVGQVIPFQALEGAFMSRDGRAVMTAYKESYSAIAYLVKRYSLYDIKQFLLAMGRGMNPEQAFQDTFYITYSEFAKSWGKG